MHFSDGYNSFKLSSKNVKILDENTDNSVIWILEVVVSYLIQKR